MNILCLVPCTKIAQTVFYTSKMASRAMILISSDQEILIFHGCNPALVYVFLAEDLLSTIFYPL